MASYFATLDELGTGPGFRKIRSALGITAFGANAIVLPPGLEGFHHYHERQDELYFVHAGTVKFEVGDEERVLGPGGLCHVPSTTPRRVSNVGDDEAVVVVVGGAGGYVGRDGMLVDMDDLARRQAYGSAADARD